MTKFDWRALLTEQRSQRFTELSAAQASVTLPISDRLLTRVIAQHHSAEWPIRRLEIRALEGDTFDVRLRVKRPALLPAFRIRLAIVQQPQLPDSPLLVLHFGSDGVSRFASAALRLLSVLPPGITHSDDGLLVDIRTLLRSRGLDDALDYLSRLEVHTASGRIIVSAEARVPTAPVSRTVGAPG